MNINEKLAEWIRKQPEDWVIDTHCPVNIFENEFSDYCVRSNYENCRKCWEEALNKWR